MKFMKLRNTLLMYTVLMLLMAGCKKGAIETPEVPENLLEVDLTGIWNGYKYIDQSGLVPLEVIRIERKEPGSAHYIATKLKGDNSVSAGAVTWEGLANANPFWIAITLGDGSGNNTVATGVQMQIVDPNTLKGIGANLIFVRRTDGHF